MTFKKNNYTIILYNFIAAEPIGENSDMISYLRKKFKLLVQMFSFLIGSIGVQAFSKESFSSCVDFTGT